MITKCIATVHVFSPSAHLCSQAEMCHVVATTRVTEQRQQLASHQHLKLCLLESARKHARLVCFSCSSSFVDTACCLSARG